MNDEKMRQLIHTGIDRHCATLTSDPYRVQRVLNKAHEVPGTGGFVVKKKMSTGLFVAVILMLVTVTAVAAILLSGKDFVNLFLAPMSSQTEADVWNEEELNQILVLAEENGLKINDDIRSALASSASIYKEELMRMFMKIDLGFYPATWPLEEQASYDELLVKYGLKEERTRFLPVEGEISEEEAIDIAEKYVLENWNVDLNEGQYTRYTQYMLSQDDESGIVSKIWDIEYEAEDGTVYVLCLTPEGSVIEDEYATYIHRPRNRSIEVLKFLEYQENFGNRRAFWWWSYDVKAAFSAEVGPMVANLESVNSEVAAATFYTYGLPAESELQYEDALTIARKVLAEEYGLTNKQVLAHSYLLEAYDVSDPDKPMWKFVFINPDDFYGIRYRVLINGRTGEIILHESYPWQTNFVDEEYDRRLY